MSDSPELNSPRWEALALEYSSLREEILKRVEMRQQFLSITLTFAAAFLGIGISTKAVSLVYPPLAMLLALSWYQNDRLIRQLSLYIRQKHEAPGTGLGWETEVQRIRNMQNASHWRSVVLSHGGIFLVTQGMAIAIGLSNFTESTIEWVLLGIDMMAVLFVVRLFWHSR